MMMIHPKEATKDEAMAATWVLWDINRCPIPSDVDASRVGPCIKRALKNLGYNGPLNITVIGILTEVPPDVLRKLCSTGIALKHVPTETTSITSHVVSWSLRNPPPVNFMMISVEPNFGHHLASFESEGCNILWSLFPYDIEASPKILQGWKTLLPKLREGICPTEAHEENCGETGKSSLLCSFATTCRDDKFDDIESFIKHIYSKPIFKQEFQYYCDFHEEDATNIMKLLEKISKI